MMHGGDTDLELWNHKQALCIKHVSLPAELVLGLTSTSTYVGSGGPERHVQNCYIMYYDTIFVL